MSNPRRKMGIFYLQLYVKNYDNKCVKIRSGLFSDFNITTFNGLNVHRELLAG
jgi:hypothetical protein